MDLADLITNLEEAQAAGKLAQRMKVLTHPTVLVADELGYLPVSRTGAMLFFQMIARRYERASTVLTSNRSFEEWGILGDEVMPAALIDRLLHHCHIINIPHAPPYRAVALPQLRRLGLRLVSSEENP